MEATGLQLCWRGYSCVRGTVAVLESISDITNTKSKRSLGDVTKLLLKKPRPLNPQAPPALFHFAIMNSILDNLCT